MADELAGAPDPGRDQDRTFNRLLRRLEEAPGLGSGPGVVIVDVRGFDMFSSASEQLLQRYASDLNRTGNHLVLCGVSTPLYRHLLASGLDRVLGAENLIEAVNKAGGDAEAAYERAITLLGGADRLVPASSTALRSGAVPQTAVPAPGRPTHTPVPPRQGSTPSQVE